MSIFPIICYSYNKILGAITMKKTFIFLNLLSFIIFMSCGKGDTETEELDKILDGNEDSQYVFDDGQAIDSEQKTQTEPQSVSDADNFSSGDVDELRRLVRAGAFKKAISMNSTTSYEDKYYTGVAYYSLMKQKADIPNSIRAGYRDKAISLLENVGWEARDESLQSRALLWYAMAIHLNYSDLSKKRIALGALHRIQTTRLKDTPAYDDSLLITGQIYTKMGWYIQARKFFKKLKSADSVDGRVWNPEEKSYQSPGVAADLELEKVRRICFSE